MTRSGKGAIRLPSRPGAHPEDTLLRAERLPHIWCPGCGIGPALGAYVEALQESEVPLKQQVIVSGIGCTGRSAGYVNIDSFHTTHGRAIPFATGMKIANPDLKITVFSGDGDLFAIGGNHFIHAARRNIDLNVICINNFNYGMTGGQLGPTTPPEALTSTSPYGHEEESFNLPYLAACAGAVFVARWTSLHFLQLKRAIRHAMQKEGFTFIEVLSPCPPGFGGPNSLGEGLDQMRWYKEKATINPQANLETIGLELGDAKIVLGDFVDRERPSYLARQQLLAQRARGN
ncbi:MAG TPA: 2-oxoacid:ferredoxin oxidoreductase subunit beta [Candidatus Fraserbacteria bacterium]|nr:2-oxoacid:ferredoxin oxidoreductase subunit beta [Candidatus Fraserbacteria bacterium]